MSSDNGAGQLVCEQRGLREVKAKFDELTKSDGSKPLESTLLALRRMVFFHGIGEPKANLDNETTFRGQMWKLMLGVLHEKKGADPVAEYTSLIERKKSSCYSKIRDDSFRTLRNCALFDITTQEPKVIRILNSYCHWSGKTYTQGLNNILGPFLVCMNEMDAFFAFERLLGRITPTYWMTYKRTAETPGGFLGVKGQYLGARAACRLADKILIEVDPELHGALMSSFARGMPLRPVAYHFHEMYTFRHMQVFSTAIRPLREVVRLWDRFFALGFHMHVVAYVAQLLLMRDRLLDSSVNINNLLRQDAWPELNARSVVSVVAMIAPKLSRGLVRELRAHTTDVALCRELVTWRDTTEQKTQKQRRQRAKSADKSSLQGSVGAARAQMHLRSPGFDRGRSVAMGKDGCSLS